MFANMSGSVADTDPTLLERSGVASESPGHPQSSLNRLTRILAAVEEENPARQIIVDQCNTWSASDVLLIAAAIGSELHPGDRLAVVADTYPIVLASVFAAFQVGGRVALISPLQRDIEGTIYDFDASKVLWLPNDGALNGGPTVPGQVVHEKTVSIDKIAPVHLATRRPRRAVDVDGAAYLVLSTSGTGGKPKLVAHTESSVIAGYKLVRSVWFEMLAPDLLTLVNEIGENDGGHAAPWFGAAADLGVEMTYLSGIPVASVGGLSAGIQALLSGGRIVRRPLYTPEDILNAVQIHQVTSLVVPPITAQRLVRSATCERGACESLVVVGLGGSGVPPGLHQAIERTFNCRVVTGYGATELGGVVATTRFTDPDEERWTTIGRAVPGVDLRVCGDGELQVKSPALGDGYLLESGDLMPFPTDSGWYCTGDVVAAIESGSYRFIGRSSGVIVRGGRKIHPEIIEAVLREHEDIRDCAVVGAVSRVAGEEDIVAFIVVHGRVEISELRQLCVRRLGPSYSPRRVVVIERIPMDSVGKRDLARLRDMATYRETVED